jgi:hypothetical protein
MRKLIIILLLISSKCYSQNDSTFSYGHGFQIIPYIIGLEYLNNNSINNCLVGTEKDLHYHKGSSYPGFIYGLSSGYSFVKYKIDFIYELSAYNYYILSDEKTSWGGSTSSVGYYYSRQSIGISVGKFSKISKKIRLENDLSLMDNFVWFKYTYNGDPLYFGLGDNEIAKGNNLGFRISSSFYLALSKRIEFKSGLSYSYSKINDNNRNFDLSYNSFNWINCFIVNINIKNMP